MSGITMATVTANLPISIREGLGATVGGSDTEEVGCVVFAFGAGGF